MNYRFIRRGEYDSEFGGKGNAIEAAEKQLPFDCCALSFQPYSDPVCTPDGIIYDMAYVPFLANT